MVAMKLSKPLKSNSKMGHRYAAGNKGIIIANIRRNPRKCPYLAQVMLFPAEMADQQTQ